MNPVLAALHQALIEHAATLVERHKLDQIFERAQQLLLNPEGERFEEFWKLYPRKLAKDTALRAWRKMQGDQHFDAIMANIRLRLRVKDWETTPERKQFIPHATTYLNQRRWLDKPDVDGRRDARGYVPYEHGNFG